jgi:Phosphotransferase enzyme family
VTPTPLDLLLGPDAGELMGVVVAGCGGTLRALRVSTVSVQPTGASVVQYSADVERSDGVLVRERLTATTGDRIPHGAAVLAGHGIKVGVWRWPHDPALPALATAADPVRLADTLQAAGLADGEPLHLRLRAYRPGRRAVVQIDCGDRRLYAKVVRPSALDALCHRHKLLAERLPVPPVLTVVADGLVVLPEVPGTPMRALLTDAAAPPDPTALEALLDALPEELLGLPVRRTHLDRVQHFAGVLALTAPAERPQVDALAAALIAVDPGTQPVVPVHGDFYEGQLLVDAGTVSGLLDVDTAGRGHRIDEWATLLAHLSVLALHGCAPARHYGTAVLAHAERRFPAAQLRPRIAAAVFGLATGPFRVQERGWPMHTRARLELARRWLPER